MDSATEALRRHLSAAQASQGAATSAPAGGSSQFADAEAEPEAEAHGHGHGLDPAEDALRLQQVAHHL